MKRSESFNDIDNNNFIESKKFINSLFLKKSNSTKIEQKYMLKNIIHSNNLKLRSFSFNDVEYKNTKKIEALYEKPAKKMKALYKQPEKRLSKLVVESKVL